MGDAPCLLGRTWGYDQRNQAALARSQRRLPAVLRRQGRDLFPAFQLRQIPEPDESGKDLRRCLRQREGHSAVLTTFPGVFTGIGEFSIHKEFVSAKIPGETASLTNPALDRILDFAAEAGLVVIIHNDVDMPFAKTDAPPVYLEQMRALLKRHQNASIIWAHVGLGRIVHPVQISGSAEAATRNPTQFEIVESMLEDPACNHVDFDISWDEVAKYAVASPESIARVSTILNRYPDRFLFGTDTVAPSGPAAYYAVFDIWKPVWSRLTADASQKVRIGNYERIFDEGRRRVRAWEKANAK
jgi:predicted TIM-barrel fold metal-dependent hydrolase